MSETMYAAWHETVTAYQGVFVDTRPHRAEVWYNNYDRPRMRKLNVRSKTAHAHLNIQTLPATTTHAAYTNLLVAQ